MLTAIKTFLSKRNLTRILIIALVIAIAIIYFFARHNAKIKTERDRYQNNYQSLETGMEEITTKDSLKGVRIRELELNREELKDYYEGELANTLKSMDIRLRKMESFTNTAIETTNNINTVFRDTIIQDTVQIEKLEYRSQWFDIDITKQGHEALIKAVSRDSLIQVVYWDREGFWPLRWTKRKQYFQNIISANPDSRITYSRYIVPEKLRTRK